VGLGQHENGREKDNGEAGQHQERLTENCLECIHRRRPLELDSDTGRGRPRLLAAGLRVAALEAGWQMPSPS
jgi:hypothetical protein